MNRPETRWGEQTLWASPISDKLTSEGSDGVVLTGIHGKGCRVLTGFGVDQQQTAHSLEQ